MTITAAQIFGFIMVASFMVSYIPQIIKIYRTRSSDDISITLLILSAVGYMSALVYMFLTSFGIWWLANYSFGLTMSLILIHAWFKFHNAARTAKTNGPIRGPRATLTLSLPPKKKARMIKNRTVK